MMAVSEPVLVRPQYELQEKSTKRRWRPPLPLLVILGMGAVVRVWLLSRGVPTPDSDEGMVGLMALHMAHGEWTVFLWGQAYMGSLESLCIAPVLYIFGASGWALHLAPMPIGLAAVASSYYLCAWLMARSIGLVVAALLAMGSPFFVVLSMRAFGGYVETLLFGNLLFALALRGAYPAGRTPRMVALFGMIAGVALWTNLLVSSFLIAAGAIFWWQQRTDLLKRNGLFLLGGLGIGASPAIIDNVLNGGATVTTILGIIFTGGNGAHLTPTLALANLWQFVTVSLPIVIGQGLGGTQSNGWDVALYQGAAARHPAIFAIDLLFTGAVIALVVSAAIPLARHWRALFVAARAITPDHALLRRQFEAALLILVVCYAGAFCLKPNQLFGTPRYLFPLVAALPLVVGQVERLARWLVARRQCAWPYWRQATVALAFLPLILWNLAGDLALTPLQTAAQDHGVWIAGSDATLLQILRDHHVHSIITDSYWSSLRLCFASGETIIPYDRNPDGTPGFNRYAPYVTRTLADPHPAYLNLTGTPGMQGDLTRFQDGDMPGYMMTTIGIYTLFLPAE